MLGTQPATFILDVACQRASQRPTAATASALAFDADVDAVVM
jgi:hypothetical protein